MAGKNKWEVKVDFKVPKIKTPKEGGKKAASEARRVLTQALLEASKQVETELKPLLDLSLSANVWDWPRDTVRKNGSVAGTTRDITDLGRLRDSLVLDTKFMQTKTQTLIKYNAPHANIVYYGGVIQPYGNPAANSVLIPGRPWVEAIINGTHGLPQYDLLNVYAEKVTEVWDTGG